MIKEISEVLGDEDWNLIDLTLEQFGMPITEVWEDDNRKNYVVQMIKNAGDSDLSSLSEHLRPKEKTESIEAPTFWEPDEPRVFISHLAKDKKIATSLKISLNKYHIACFVAHEDIEPTDEWQFEIEKALLTMDALVAILTPGFNNSKWTDQEIGAAIGRRVPIVPLRVGMNSYGLFGKYQALRAAGKAYSVLSDEIFELLIRKPDIGSRISSVLVEKLIDANSWESARELMDIVERCKHFGPTTIDRLEKAEDLNVKVKEAWYVPGKIKNLISKYRG